MALMDIIRFVQGSVKTIETLKIIIKVYYYRLSFIVDAIHHYVQGNFTNSLTRLRDMRFATVFRHDKRVVFTVT